MRPVTKPNPALIPVGGGNHVLAYAYHTPASLNGNITFGVGAVPTCFGAAAPFNRTVNDLLNDLLQLANGNNPYPMGTALQRSDATGTIRERLTNAAANPPGYRAANPQLDARLGHYCSFCEIQKPGHEIAVEHRIPKAHYPVPFVWWGNFLQACSRCNSTKGDIPSFATYNIWDANPSPPTPVMPFEPFPAAPGGSPPLRANETPVMQVIVDRHFWPDLDPTSFQRVTYQMQDAGNAYAAIGSAEAANINNGGATFYNYAVTANCQLVPAGPIVADVAVEVVALRNNAASVAAGAACAPAAVAAGASATAAAAAVAARASATAVNPTVGAAIGGVADTAAAAVGATAATVQAAVAGAAAAIQLAHQTKTDRTLTLTGLDVQDSARAGYRTDTWFSMLGIISNFENRLAANIALMTAAGVPVGIMNQLSAGMFDVFWLNLLVMAKARGFYSTIHELLAQFPYPAFLPPHPPPPAAPVAFANLAARFVYDSDPANGGPQMSTIPGTDATYIP